MIRTLQGSSPIRARVGNPGEPHPQTDLPYVLIGDDAAFVAETTATLAIMTPFSHFIRSLIDRDYHYKSCGGNHLFFTSSHYMPTIINQMPTTTSDTTASSTRSNVSSYQL
jgi:hypothetical protein